MNSTGDEYFDELTAEYNSILIDSSYFNPDALLDTRFILETNSNIDELHLPFMSNIDVNEDSNYFHKVNKYPSYWIDLEIIRASKKDYINFLSKNCREKIRRSTKEYSKMGAVVTEFANNEEEALKMLEELSILHQQEWIERGKPGAFSNEFFIQFHKLLITRRFKYNEIQLVKIRAGSYIIGYLYNFIFNNQVLFYQCGFQYEKSNHLRPGFVSHYHVILECIDKGYNKYNFLAGDAQYKKSMSTGVDELSTIIISKKTIITKIEFFLDFIRGKFRTNE